ncbi:MAG: hypothetical protein U5N55_03015 [Cypionkella sp.]|nr:hypothetical protein [Cypionkella sp.]
MRALLPLVVAALLAAPLWAKPGTPGPEYFVGSYELVGRSGGALTLTSQAARITVDGQGVVIRSCGAPDLPMGFGPAFEIVNLMTGGVERG